MRYFKIYTPDRGFTGTVGAVAFANGEATVSFDDTRLEAGTGRDGKPIPGACPADADRVQVGRSAVLFAKRRGYRLVEVDELGRPLATEETTTEETSAKPARGARKDS